ncbi:MAG: hypothetical protein WBD26_06010, partial [Candidatus Acidiferrales bacterium]
MIATTMSNSIREKPPFRLAALSDCLLPALPIVVPNPSFLFFLGILSASLCSLLFALCSLLFALCSLLFALCSLLFALALKR